MAEVTNPVVITDVTSRVFRTLTTAETNAATTLLDDAWYLLLSKPVGDHVMSFFVDEDDELIDPVDPVFLHNVKRICANAIIRVVNNPEGFLEAEGDDFRARRDAVVSTGRLYFMDEELAELAENNGSGDAFTIRPGGARTLRPPLPENAFWDPIDYGG